MSKTINLPDGLNRRIPDAYPKIAASAANFNHARDAAMRQHYLEQLRGHAGALANTPSDAFRAHGLTADQTVDAVSDHRAAGQQVLALCDAVTI